MFKSEKACEKHVQLKNTYASHIKYIYIYIYQY